MQDDPPPPPVQRSARDIATGLFLMATAAAGLLLSRGLTIGSASQMGPGYVPLAAFTLIFALGLTVLVTGLRNGPDPLERWAVRELAFVLVAMTAFGILLERAGLAVALFVMVAIAGLADRTQTIRGVAGLAVFIVALCWAVFIVGLGLNVPFLPPANLFG